MLNLMIAVLLLMTLSGGLDFCYGDKLKCAFTIVDFRIPDYSQYNGLYSCKVTSFNNFNIIDGYTGVHKTNRNVSDVIGIFVINTNIELIPDDIGQLFNIMVLEIGNSQLVEIRADNFLGMQELEVLKLHNNNLTSLPSNTFSYLPKLKYISLNNNQISEIPSGLFTNNLKLEQIHLYGNKIKFLSSGVFDGLTKLNIVDLQSNICEINQLFKGTIRIEKLKKEMNFKCKNPNDPHEIFIKLKHQHEEIIQEKEALEKVKNALKKNYDALVMTKDALLKEKDVEQNMKEFIRENQEETKIMMKHILDATKEHQLECNENIKLRAELVKAKDQQKTAQHENDQLEKKFTDELTDLKKELTEVQKTIHQKLPKMEQLIEDFYMEVMDLKIERHNERQNSIALRSKLMEAKEQLAECKNE